MLTPTAPYMSARKNAANARSPPLACGMTALPRRAGGDLRAGHSYTCR